MSERRTKRTIAVVDGVGAVLSGSGSVGGVRYHLNVNQEFVVVDDPSGTREIPGVREVTGTLMPSPGDSLPMAGLPLTLVMEDGNEIDFSIIDVVGGEYSIVGSAELRDARAM